ncbi:hypothetical protein KC19_VG231000 [Ceratodon purpureus]|uniref:Uncharacterized protein n=1 Tax=Ceratodon purpureus TaxID=3225 RepID=A0A8T0HU54_CERPU|nr:hypothetical protein KC19_VG231000 [Ceratodon purpureus]
MSEVTWEMVWSLERAIKQSVSLAMSELFEEVPRELQNVGAVYFSVYIDDAAMEAPLVIPKQFTARCKWPRASDCMLVTSLTNKREWGIKFEL